MPLPVENLIAKVVKLSDVVDAYDFIVPEDCLDRFSFGDTDHSLVSPEGFIGSVRAFYEGDFDAELDSLDRALAGVDFVDLEK